MKIRRIADLEVSAIGLGCMPMSIEGRPEDARSIATIHAALDEGVTLFDTADAYHLGAGARPWWRPARSTCHHPTRQPPGPQGAVRGLPRRDP